MIASVTSTFTGTFMRISQLEIRPTRPRLLPHQCTRTLPLLPLPARPAFNLTNLVDVRLKHVIVKSVYCNKSTTIAEYLLYVGTGHNLNNRARWLPRRTIFETWFPFAKLWSVGRLGALDL